METNLSVTTFTRGQKRYELADHLGNVLATISDKRIARDDGGDAGTGTAGDGIADAWLPDLVTAQEYYVFGGVIADRSYTQGGESYRYGFGGHEKADNIAGPGNHLVFGDYGYDPRIGRRWNVDPHTENYPSTGGYVTLGNNPLIMTDPDGKDIVYFNLSGKEVHRVKSATEHKTLIQCQRIPRDPSKSGVGWKEVPMPNVIQYKINARTGAHEPTTAPTFQRFDHLIAARVGLFNQTRENGLLDVYSGDGKTLFSTNYSRTLPTLDPTLVKGYGDTRNNNGPGR